MDSNMEYKCSYTTYDFPETLNSIFYMGISITRGSGFLVAKVVIYSEANESPILIW